MKRYKINILLFLYDLKQLFDIVYYTSAIQAKTFSIIKQLNGSMNGYRRYSITSIVTNIMKLQELMLDGNELNYYKIRKVYNFTHYILSRNDYCDTCFIIPETNKSQIREIINEITLNLSTDNYLNEHEIRQIIEKHRIKLKYKKEKYEY